MVDPVVSSRYGTRPLLDIPAMQVSSTSHQQVPSLQHHNVPPLQLDTHNDPGLPRQVAHVPRPYHTAPPPDPYYHHDPYHPREYSHYYDPNGGMVKPSPMYLPPHEKYPGVHVPYSSYQPPPRPPPPIHHPASAPMPPPMNYNRMPQGAAFDRGPQTFDVTCELDYGRVAHISVRESHGHFRGIPDYLRRELMKTYGRYPFMEVKIRFENGDYHIYANHDKRQHRRERDNHERERPRHRYDEEDSDYFEERTDRRSRADDDDSMTDGIRPREMGAPRGILRERGWNHYR